ncbi:MAG: terminase family protein [Pseudomonadota bacterium]
MARALRRAHVGDLRLGPRHSGNVAGAQPLVIDTGFRPHKGHLELFHSASRFTICVAHRRWGKTVAACALLVTAAMQAAYQRLAQIDQIIAEGRNLAEVDQVPVAQFAYIAPFLKQARRVAWRYVKSFALRTPHCRALDGDNILRWEVERVVRGQKLKVTLGEVHLYGADNADAMRGMYFMGVVGDELADWRPEVLPEVILPTLADYKGWLFIIGTPKGENLLADLWRKWQKRRDAACLMFPASVSDVLPADELGLQRSVLTDAQYRQEFECDFSASAENILLTIDQILRAQERGKSVDEPDFRGLSRIMGVDVARFGDDRSSIGRRIGNWWQEPIVRKGIDNMELAALVAHEAERFQPDAIFVDAGRGEGVIDRLRQMGHRAIEVNFGGTPDDPTYADKRSEMWDLMAQAVTVEAVLPISDELLRDLAAPTYDFMRSTGKFHLEAKKDMKARIGRSPDVGDAYALTYAYPVVPKSWRSRSDTANTDFDPMEGV